MASAGSRPVMPPACRAKVGKEVPRALLNPRTNPRSAGLLGRLERDNGSGRFTDKAGASNAAGD